MGRVVKYPTFLILKSSFSSVNTLMSNEAAAFAKGFPISTGQKTSVSSEDSLVLNKYVFVAEGFHVFSPAELLRKIELFPSERLSHNWFCYLTSSWYKWSVDGEIQGWPRGPSQTEMCPPSHSICSSSKIRLCHMAADGFLSHVLLLMNICTDI